jgi:hypothetical protein
MDIERENTIEVFGSKLLLWLSSIETVQGPRKTIDIVGRQIWKSGSLCFVLIASDKMLSSAKISRS